ncbi:MAG: TldD/PmbA family protein [Nannocystaceae bacterium]|nr:metallopeptidase TldD-related protein [bacterium]
MMRATLLGLSALLTLGCRPGIAGQPDPAVWGASSRGGEAKKVRIERAEAEEGEEAQVLAMLERELERNFAQLQGDAVEEPAYYLGYELTDRTELWMVAEAGAMLRDQVDRDRAVDVDVRVGSEELDNSHAVDGDYGPGNGLGSGLPISLGDDELSLAQGLWIDTDAQYQQAVASYREVLSAEQLRSEGDGESHPDFSLGEPLTHVEPEASMDLAPIRAQYRGVLQEVSAELAADDAVLQSNVTFSAVVDNTYFVDSHGARVQTSSTRLRILYGAIGQADDGMTLQRTATFEAHLPDQLPSVETLMETATRLRDELVALRNAPVADPYTGPAILEGRAAGVFFHEIFGHRLEGHRQKDDLEGQTFTDMIGKQVLPKFLDVIDDPTVSMLGGVPLSGHYFVDDEGVRSRRSVLVERGKLEGFLLSRSLVSPFRKSNGHGRREPGNQVVARQGNLIVSSRRSMSAKALRKALIEEVKRQKKPYGLVFKDIEGGYTITDRSGPQAFKVQPLMVFRVYPDGRPDELVRGVEIVGTPLSAFETIVATDDTPGIFNGMCGAESGWVPVSAVSPSLLLRGIEIERAMHEREKPPLLPPPPTSTLRRSR